MCKIATGASASSGLVVVVVIAVVSSLLAAGVAPASALQPAVPGARDGDGACDAPRRPGDAALECATSSPATASDPAEPQQRRSARGFRAAEEVAEAGEDSRGAPRGWQAARAHQMHTPLALQAKPASSRAGSRRRDGHREEEEEEEEEEGEEGCEGSLTLEKAAALVLLGVLAGAAIGWRACDAAGLAARRQRALMAFTAAPPSSTSSSSHEPPSRRLQRLQRRRSEPLLLLAEGLSAAGPATEAWPASSPAAGSRSSSSGGRAASRDPSGEAISTPAASSFGRSTARAQAFIAAAPSSEPGPAWSPAAGSQAALQRNRDLLVAREAKGDLSPQEQWTLMELHHRLWKQQHDEAWMQLEERKLRLETEKLDRKCQRDREEQALRSSMDSLLTGFAMHVAVLIVGAVQSGAFYVAQGRCSSEPEAPGGVQAAILDFAGLSEAALALSGAWCFLQAAGELFASLLGTGLVAYVVLTRGYLQRADSMPFAVVILLLGLFCGWGGQMTVEAAGGRGGTWLACWAIWILLHLLARAGDCGAGSLGRCTAAAAGPLAAFILPVLAGCWTFDLRPVDIPLAGWALQQTRRLLLWLSF